MFPQGCGELEELIRILYDGDQSGTNGGLKDDEYLLTKMNNLLLEDRDKTEQVVGLLKEDFNKNEVYYVKLRASISIMLAYASCKLEDQRQVLYYAKTATNPFWHTNFWNRALAFWFLGIAQKNSGNFTETRDALTKAKDLLEKHAKEAHRKGYGKTRERCDEYISSIEQALNVLPAPTIFSRSKPENKEAESPLKRVFDRLRGSSSSTTRGPEPTPLKQDDLTANQARFRQTRRGDETPPSDRESQESSSAPRSSSFHIIIPVDTQALMNPQGVSGGLDASLYTWLREYNLWKPDRSSTNIGEQAKNPKSAKKPRFIVPPFSIFGRATAGPKGEVTFEEPERANGVTEDYKVEFCGKKHTVYSTREKDSQIKTVVGNIYGWLKIAGESMNLAKPTPINDQDYVLFCKINNLESCENKIVIVTQPGLDERYPLLIVKRLVVMDPKSKRSSNTAKKYYLRSESSLDEYKDDIEFTEENQLIGEVIAVAKP